MLICKLEKMESDLLQMMKKMNSALSKELRANTAEHYVESGGISYHTKQGGIGGNPCEVMILVSVGSEFPADTFVKQRIKNHAMAEKAAQTYGSLPFIVPGLYEEAAADLMATASAHLKAPNSTVVQLHLDVPMMQRSKQYYLKKIGEFLEYCKQPGGMFVSLLQNICTFYYYILITHSYYRVPGPQ